MTFDKRNQGISLIRQWAREEATKGRIREAHAELLRLQQSLPEEFRTEFEVPGARYWEHPESDSRFSTSVGEPISAHTAETCIELTRAEFIGRSGLHFGYDDSL